MTTLDELQKTSYAVAEEHGFHKAQEALPPETLALYLRLLLTIGELSEAAEELRAGHAPTDVYYEYDINGAPGGAGIIVSDKPYMVLKGVQPVWFDEMTPALEMAQTEYGAELGHKNVLIGKPAGFPIELADAQIRLADLAESCGVSLSLACRAKESYNRGRAFMHGKTA